MSARAREKLATQVNPDVLAAVRQIAKAEGRQPQALVDEALSDLVEERKLATPRTEVMAVYQTSLAKFRLLYKKLAE